MKHVDFDTIGRYTRERVKLLVVSHLSASKLLAVFGEGKPERVMTGSQGLERPLELHLAASCL